MSQTSSPELMRQQNRAVVLAKIQEQGPISRVELANLLGLNPATITRITRDLIGEGLVTEEGEGESKGAGRKRVLLQFNHSARLAVAIHCGSRQVTGVIADLACNILERRTALISPRLTLPLLTSLMGELLEENPSYRQRLAAICLSATALDNSLADGLKQTFHVPVFSIEPAALAATAEAETGAICDIGSVPFAVFYLGAKSDSCLYLNERPWVGRLGLTCDGQPLSERACDAGLIASFEAARRRGTASTLSDAATPGLIFEAARRGDEAACEAIEKTADDLAFASAWLANALNIEHIVLAGNWVRAADLFLPAIKERIAAPQVLAAKLGDDAPLIGAVRVAIRSVDTIF
jgi:predicted NBD/HSP70 family sugar kinase